MMDPRIDPARLRAEEFARAAHERLDPLCEDLKLTLGEVQIGYVLLLAECLSHYDAPFRQTFADHLRTWLPELAETFAQRRASAGH